MKHIKNVFLVCILSARALLAANAVAIPETTPLKVTLQSEAVSQTDKVLLSEFASISGLPNDKLIELENLSVGRAAFPGQIREISSVDILGALRRTGFKTPVEFAGARSAKVTAVCQTITGQQIADAASSAICMEVQKDKDLEAFVEISSMPIELTLRPGQVELLPVFPQAGLAPGSRSMCVTVIQDGRKIAEPVVGFKLRITGSIQVAAERISTGEILTAPMIKIIRKELSASEMQERGDMTKWVGMRAKAVILNGQVLSKSQFTLPHVISRGDAVTVYVRRGGLELATRGEAKGNAAMGESIRILTEMGTELMARASGPREASIDDLNDLGNR